MGIASRVIALSRREKKSFRKESCNSIEKGLRKGKRADSTIVFGAGEKSGIICNGKPGLGGAREKGNMEEDRCDM